MTTTPGPEPPTDWLRPHPKGCILSVRLQPGAKKSAILGLYGEGNQAALKIAVQAPPIDGRANEALIAFLAERCNLPKFRVEILSGQSSRSKSILFVNLSLQAVHASLHAEY